MRNTPKSLNEELMKMRKLMDFDISENSHNVLSESNVEKSILLQFKKRDTSADKFIGMVYDIIVEVGEKYGLVHAGLKALSSLRLEKGYRDYGHDMDNTDTSNMYKFKNHC